MHSSYQLRETHYADLSLSVHDRINALHRQADNLAAAVAESALDSGCTDRTSYDGLGPRQAKAWDLVAEAHGWNAISDKPEELAKAETAERDGRSYRVGYGDSGFGVQELEEPEAAETEHGGAESASASVQLYVSAITQKIHTSKRCSVTRRNHALNLETSATASELAAKGYVGCKRCGAYEELLSASPEPEADEVRTFHGPDYLAANADSRDRILALKAKRDSEEGWTKDEEDEYYRLLGEWYDPDGSHNLREPQPPAADRPVSGAHIPDSKRCQTCHRSAHTATNPGLEHGHPFAPAEAEPFTIDGQPACGEPVDGGRCSRAPGHGPEHPHIADSSTIPAIPEEELRTAVDGHYHISTRGGRTGKLTGAWARRPGGPLADPYVRFDSGAFYAVHADAIVSASPDTEDVPDGPKRYGAGSGWTLAQARQAMAKVGAELQAAADSGELSRVLGQAEEPKPQANCAVACPAWCGASHGGELDGTSHQLRRYIGKDRDGAEGWVTLYMVDYGQDNKILADLNGQIDIHVHWLATHKAAIRPLAEAEPFAQEAEAFGRADIARLIRELAAVGHGKPRTQVYTPPQPKPEADPIDPDNADAEMERRANQLAHAAEEAGHLSERLKIARDSQTSITYVSRYTQLVAFVKPSGELLKVYRADGTLAGLLYQGPDNTFRPVTHDHCEPAPYVSMALAAARILTTYPR